MISTIVLGYDGSSSAKAALAGTVGLARQTGARVVVVFGYYVSPLAGGDVHDFKLEVEKVGNHAIARAIADLESAGIRTESRLASGKPADVLLEVAKEVGADVIVVGTVGENPITGAILGSVVLRLVQRSPLPVLVVPTTEGE